MKPVIIFPQSQIQNLPVCKKKTLTILKPKTIQMTIKPGSLPLDWVDEASKLYSNKDNVNCVDEIVLQYRNNSRLIGDDQLFLSLE